MRLTALFNRLKVEGRAGLAIFTTAGDPDGARSAQVIKTLLAEGVDLLEIGMPFSDPMAEGVAIQKSSQRALAAGATMKKTFALVEKARKENDTTPIILMGYYNPMLAYGIEAWATDAARAGVDGVIVVDVPPEEDGELYQATQKNNLAVVRLIAPTSEKRFPILLERAQGFLYYVSITGTTGAASPDFAAVETSLATLRKQTDLPIALGFGIKTPDDCKKAAALADLVVIGSAFVELVAKSGGGGTDEEIADFVKTSKEAVLSVKK